MEDKYYVYCHTNKLNSKKYIGITSRVPEKRWGNNGYNYKSSPHFYYAIQKYGWDGFEHEILFVYKDKTKAEEKERELISINKTFIPQYGYNIEMGGNYKGKHSKETRQKISESKIGKPRSAETKEKVSKGLKGKMTGSKNAKSKMVMCVETGEIFESTTAAANNVGTDQSSISRCCSGSLKTTRKLHFVYYILI